MKTILKILALSFALMVVGTPSLSAQSSRTATVQPAPQLKFSIAPNPCKGQLTAFYFLPASIGNGQIEVVQSGRGTVMRIPISGQGVVPIDLSKMPKGVHYIRLVTAGNSQGQRIMLL